MSSFFRILRYARSYRLIIFISILSSVIFVLFNAISLWIISSLISLIMGGGSQAQEIGGTEIYKSIQLFADSIINVKEPTDKLKLLCLILFFSFIAKNLFYYLSNICLSYAEGWIITDIRNNLYSKLITLPTSFFDKRKVADISSISIRDVSKIRDTFTQTIQNLINEPINITVFLILLFIINPYMTILILLIVPISGFIVYMIGHKIRLKAKESSQQIGGIMTILHDSVKGIKVVKSFSLGNFLKNKFTKENNKFRLLLLKQDQLRHLITPINDIVGVSIGIVLLWFIGSQVLADDVGLRSNDFIKYIVYLFAMLQPTRKLSNANALIQASLASSERVFSIIDYSDNYNQTDRNCKLTFESKITISNVKFKYDNDANYTLNDINMTINKNEVVSIVGESGSGKSSLINIILGFYTNYKGDLRFDGLDAKEIYIKDIRNLISYVPQETILFNDTLMENIRYGNPGAKDSDVIKAAKSAHAYEFINKLENGFNTLIHENGVNLSGGQRQRIAIARAILKNSPILILDEATSSLDLETKSKVIDALKNLFINHTVIIISHSLNTAQLANRVFVLENGKIVEYGSHAELMRINGIYKNLYETEDRW